MNYWFLSVLVQFFVNVVELLLLWPKVLKAVILIRCSCVIQDHQLAKDGRKKTTQPCSASGHDTTQRKEAATFLSRVSQGASLSSLWQNHEQIAIKCVLSERRMRTRFLSSLRIPIHALSS